jgi:HEAT repeat protein
MNIMTRLSSKLLLTALFYAFLNFGVSQSRAQESPPTIPSPESDLPSVAAIESVTLEPEVHFHPRLAELWLKALERPEPGTRLQAAEAFLAAARQGMPGLDEIQRQLVEHFQDESDLYVRRVLVELLVEIKAEDARQIDWSAVDDPAIRIIVDPMLDSWQSDLTPAIWQTRLLDADNAMQDRISAAIWFTRAQDGLVAVAGQGPSPTPEYVNTITEIFDDPQTPGRLLMTLAESASQLLSHTWVEIGQRLADQSIPRRVAAAKLLAGAPPANAEAVKALQALTGDKESVVAAAALRSLHRVDAPVGRRRAAELADHPDPGVRMAAVEAARPETPTLDREAWQLWTGLLDDRADGVRDAAVTRMWQAYESSGDESWAIAMVGQLLNQADWRGKAAAATLLGLIAQPGDDSLNRDLVQLLDHERADVRLSAATALRRITPTSQDDAILSETRERMELLLKADPTSNRGASVAELTQLVTLLGRARIDESEPMLVDLIQDKESALMGPRRAAVWAVGQLYAGQPNKPLIAKLTKRVEDRSETLPEDEVLQTLAVISIGQMDAQGQSSLLRRWAGDTQQSLSLRLAAMQALDAAGITPLPDVPEPLTESRGWFLEPLP